MGISIPASCAAFQTTVPCGTVTERPSMVSVTCGTFDDSCDIVYPTAVVVQMGCFPAVPAGREWSRSARLWHRLRSHLGFLHLRYQWPLQGQDQASRSAFR